MKTSEIIAAIIIGAILILLSVFVIHGFVLSLILFLIGIFLFLGGIGNLPPFNKDNGGNKKEYSFNVAGVSYKQDAIRDLCFDNEEYSMSKKKLIDENLIDEPIYKYEESTLGLISLLPDPDNEYDKNAIKVMHRDILLGYVPKDETNAIHKIIAGPYKATAKVYGGPYKILLESEDDGYTIEKENQNVGLRVTIKY